MFSVKKLFIFKKKNKNNFYSKPRFLIQTQIKQKVL